MITLDYAEMTGLHVRVGLVSDVPIDVDDPALTMTAVELAGLPHDATPWDVNLTSAFTVELSFERDA